jgi:predicted P-loop ATPase/GTPase
METKKILCVGKKVSQDALKVKMQRVLITLHKLNPSKVATLARLTRAASRN